MGQYVGMLIWRGWTQGFAYVEKEGIAVTDGARTLVPVRYSNGEHAILFEKPVFVFFGETISAPAELCPEACACREAIAHSTGMPEVIAILDGCYKIGVTQQGFDQLVFVRRSKDSIAHEYVVAI